MKTLLLAGMVVSSFLAPVPVPQNCGVGACDCSARSTDSTALFMTSNCRQLAQPVPVVTFFPGTTSSGDCDFITCAPCGPPCINTDSYTVSAPTGSWVGYNAATSPCYPPSATFNFSFTPTYCANVQILSIEVYNNSACGGLRLCSESVTLGCWGC